ncbi:MAG: hypothetical protein Ct9H90mP16_00070 [Candidatus Poseidoniales archaeon]|nr:MAG: hypothetical protein Ct9H90mP16_00070 [Candidatus Poseidoniales archaeon]
MFVSILWPMFAMINLIFFVGITMLRRRIRVVNEGFDWRYYSLLKEKNLLESRCKRISFHQSIQISTVVFRDLSCHPVHFMM